MCWSQKMTLSSKANLTTPVKLSSTKSMLTLSVCLCGGGRAFLCNPEVLNYRLMTAYFLLRVNLDKNNARAEILMRQVHEPKG